MEGIPQIVDSLRLPVEIPVHPHFFDHHIEGKAVLPAVEALQILATAVNNSQPGLPVTSMTRVRFDKFLYVPGDSQQIEAVVEIEILDGGDARAKLLTKTKSGKSGITRTMVHAAAHFSRQPAGDAAFPIDRQAYLEGICVEVSPERIYRELVPFGASYRNIMAPLYITEDGAIAQIAAPADLDRKRGEGILGSPFVLDAAFHAACVWAQCYRNTVAFPVGLERRRVYHPIHPGGTYFGCVTPVRTDSVPLIFDIGIYDAAGTLCEGVRGAHMRDVSAGRVMPPAWITKSGKGALLRNIRSNCRELCVSEIRTMAPFAHAALCDSEKKRFQTLGTKRKQSFLAARLACKRISRRLSGNDLKTSAADIDTLLPDATHPCCRRIDTQSAVACSVSHDDRFVIAVVSDVKTGVDVEKISTRVLRTQELFMSESEQRLVHSSKLAPAETAIRIWSIKEAVTKALDLNLAEAWNRVTVIQTGRNRSLFSIDSAGSFCAFHDTVAKHVFTLICLDG